VSEAILAIRLRALGDVVLTTPALRALHRGHPDVPIDVVTDERYAPLLEGLPGVDRVIGLRRRAGGMRAVLAAVRARGYARAVDFFGNPRSALITAASRARETYGYDLRGRRRAYRKRVSRDPPEGGARREYAAASHVRLARAAGGVDDGLDARVRVPDEARERAAGLLREAGVRRPETALGLVGAGTWATKTWPASHAAWLARRLLGSDREVMLLAGPGEEHVTETLRLLAPGLAVLPPCDVPALAAVLERLGGVVGTDSGPRHLAAALGRPTFAWFGPTHPDNWTAPDPSQGVWWTDVPCRGCNRTVCPHWVCLPELHPDRAFELVQEHFERHGRNAADLGSAAGT
jgi:lipopolysaccharide heptosyltransferase III